MWIISEIAKADCTVNCIIKEISVSGRNLTITEFTDNEEREKVSSIVVPISKDAEIIANYILYIFPRGTSEEEIEEEITGKMLRPKG